MRLAIVIFSLAAIAVSLVHIRRAEMTAQHEIQKLQLQQVALRRTIDDQEMRRAQVMAFDVVKRRAEAMAMDLTRPDASNRKTVTGVAINKFSRR